MTNARSSEKPGIVPADDARSEVDENAFDKAPEARTIEGLSVLGLSPDEVDFYDNYTPEQRKRTMRKVDLRLIPMLATMYLISHLDRSNIGNTRIEGIEADLGMSGVQWNVVLSLFFVPYVLFEVPSNILLRRFNRPSVYMGILITAWGVIMTLHGVVRDFGGLLAVRIFLGVFEAGFFPGAIYLCTFWYMPRDLASRVSWFYCASSLSGAFSGLLAAAIAKMDGVGGYDGWRWIFLIEGIVTVILGGLTFFLLVDTPRLSKWLDPEEVRFLELQGVIKQGGRFQGEGEEGGHIWTDLRACLLNWRMWLITFVQFCQSAMTYGKSITLERRHPPRFHNYQPSIMTSKPTRLG